MTLEMNQNPDWLMQKSNEEDNTAISVGGHQKGIIYKGTRKGPHADIEVEKNGIIFDSKPSQKLRNHSPDGFNWGYAGSGPDQLALALLYDVTANKNLALRYYQKFKNDIIAKLENFWELSAKEIQNWVDTQLEEENYGE